MSTEAAVIYPGRKEDEMTITKQDEDDVTTTMTMMMMMTMIPFLFVLFAFLGLADTPVRETTLPEELACRFDHLLRRLDTIADNVHPPLPVPLMAASVLFVFCTSVPRRLAAAWGRLVECAAAAAPEGFLGKAASLVLWADWLLSPFKLEDWETRGRKAEAALEETIDALEKTRTALEETRTALNKTKADLDKTIAEKRQSEAGYIEDMTNYGRVLTRWGRLTNDRMAASQNP